MSETLYQVTLRGSCFGVAVRGGKVTEAAPIARWAIGKTWDQARAWFVGKGGKVVACLF